MQDLQRCKLVSKVWHEMALSLTSIYMPLVAIPLTTIENAIVTTIDQELLFGVHFNPSLLSSVLSLSFTCTFLLTLVPTHTPIRYSRTSRHCNRTQKNEVYSIGKPSRCRGKYSFIYLLYSPLHLSLLHFPVTPRLILPRVLITLID